MEQAWFEMSEIRKRRLDVAVWVPLRSSRLVHFSGEWGHLGHREEFLGLASVAVAIESKGAVEKLDWDNIPRHSHKGMVQQDGRYFPTDAFDGYGEGLSGLYLVLDQDGNSLDPREWHLHQDLVVTLDLKREGDSWVAINEGYIEVARLQRSEDKTPTYLEIRTEHLKDYLCARRMALHVSSYRSRQEVVENASDIKWMENPVRDLRIGDRWEGRLTPIEEGGSAFGSTAAVVHLGRTDISPDDTPKIGPLDENITLTSWTVKHEGRRLVRIEGELWRSEWINPAESSPRVRRDQNPAISFLVDNAGTFENRETLIGGGKWLWFRAGVIMELTHRRGGALTWDTRDTGNVRCAPDSGVVFGVNDLGLVNVYAKDIVRLPTWQQRIWAGFNISPEGGVSAELFSAQAEGISAETEAPESLLPRAIELLNTICGEVFGLRLFREHAQFQEILSRTHRFRATDRVGLFSLAKDLARLTADSIDGPALQRIAAPPKGERWGPLKTLEKVLALKIDAEEAYNILSPLFGTYDLRLADAHLPGTDLKNAKRFAGMDEGSPFVQQGCQMLGACVSALQKVAEILTQFPSAPGKQPG